MFLSPEMVLANKLEAVLNQAQKDSLEIEDFIFHIIEPEEDDANKVLYLDSVELGAKQSKFFLDRLRDTLSGTQYVFKEEAVSLKEKCEHLLRPRKDFNKISRQITEDFAARHKGAMSAGVFVISVVSFKLSGAETRKLILLIKMDKSETFSYSSKIKDGKRVAEMREVPNSLNESRKAIQKSAVIDVSDEFAWGVLAQDRGEPRLSDYFRAFLGVTERQHDSVLTRTAAIAVRRWALTLKPAEMAAGEDSSTFAGRAIDYLKGHAQFDSDAFVEMVVRDTDKTRKKNLTASLSKVLADSGVLGQVFEPKPESLKKAERTTVYRTDEGVTISFEGDRNAVGVSVRQEAGHTVLTVRTKTPYPKLVGG
jgi:hypothetical protein